MNLHNRDGVRKAWRSLIGGLTVMSLAPATIGSSATAAPRIPAAATATGVLHSTTFKSPSGHILCEYQPSGRYYSVWLMCIVNDAPGVANGVYAMMYASGYVGVSQLDDGGPGLTKTVLHYGQAWFRSGMSCVMATSGITCRNTRGHGFKLSRLHQSKF
jgi:hypothetical protein